MLLVMLGCVLWMHLGGGLGPVGFECYGCNWAAAWVRRGIGRFSMLRDNGLGSPAGGHGAGQALLL